MLKSGFYAIAILILFAPGSGLQAQMVGGNLGLNYNNFRSLSETKAESFSGGFGYSLQIQLEDLYNPVSKLGLALQIDHFQGSFRTLNGSPMSAHIDEGTTERLQLGLVLLPIQFLFFELIQLQLGAEVNFLLSHNTTGTYWSSGVINKPYEQAYADPASDFHNKRSFGLVGKLAYRLPISTNWLLVPQFRYHHGLSADMGKVAPISSSRSIFACGLMYKLN
jgi:hypothetical protein